MGTAAQLKRAATARAAAARFAGLTEVYWQAAGTSRPNCWIDVRYPVMSALQLMSAVGLKMEIEEEIQSAVAPDAPDPSKTEPEVKVCK